MINVDALSRRSLPFCLIVEDCENNFTIRIKRAQRSDSDLHKVLDRVCINKTKSKDIRCEVVYF